MGMMSMLMGAKGGGVVNPLAGGTAVSSGDIPGGEVTVKTDGTITLSDADGQLNAQNWYLPTTTAIGSSYYVKFTITGTTYENTASSWTLITANRYARGEGSVSVQISTSAGGTPVVSSGTYTLSA